MKNIVYIIRTSDGKSYSKYGSYEDAVALAEEIVAGTELTYLIV